jgi:uncharacterized protein
MTQPAKGQEPSMEEILASIRRIIADEPAKTLRNEASRNEARHESPIKPIARNEDVPQPRGPLLPQPPARVAPLPSRPLSSHMPPQASPTIRSVRAAPAPAPVPKTQREEIDAMLAELNAGSRQALPSAQKPAPVPAPEEPALEEPASDILELTEQMEAAQSLPEAEFTSPDNLVQESYEQSYEESYEEETATEASEEPHPVAVARAAAEPHRHMRDHIRDVERESERDSYRDMSEDGLISAATTAAVDSAFNTLAQTVLVQNGRTLEDLVREMLRPMLKSWLDDNLPNMVERLVRAEIERVSRGR